MHRRPRLDPQTVGARKPPPRPGTPTRYDRREVPVSDEKTETRIPLDEV